MGKKTGRRAAVGMMQVCDAESPDDVGKCRQFIQREIAANQGLDWVRELRDMLAPAYGSTSKPSNDPQTEVGREVYQLADSILADSFPALSLPEIGRRFYNLGRAYQRLEMLALFDGMVASARRVSRANAAKSKPALDDKQWKPVERFIAARANGVSEIAACRQVAAQLRTGTFRKLPGVSVDLTADAIRKRYRKR